jgi:endonuclease YncB( thermonuclease family)
MPPCANCGAATALACAQCGGAACFCSVECQRAGAARHAPLCDRLRGLRRYTPGEIERTSARALIKTRVHHVADGDTLAVTLASRARARGAQKMRATTSVRFDGVDAPELAHGTMRVAPPFERAAQPGGEEARALIALLAPPGARVWLGAKSSGGGTDKYGRTVADLWVEQPDASIVWLQEALLHAGAAWRYADYDTSRDTRELARALHLGALESDARARRVGLWRCTPAFTPMAPHEWRHTTPQARAAEISRERDACSVPWS